MALKVFIKNPIWKVIIGSGVVLPILATYILAKKYGTTADWVGWAVMFPFSISLILFPFTGLLRDLVKSIPENTLFDLFSSLSGRRRIYDNSDKTNLPTGADIKPSPVFDMYNFSLVTGFEYLSLAIGIVILIAMVLSLFVKH